MQNNIQEHTAENRQTQAQNCDHEYFAQGRQAQHHDQTTKFRFLEMVNTYTFNNLKKCYKIWNKKPPKYYPIYQYQSQNEDQTFSQNE